MAKKEGKNLGLERKTLYLNYRSFNKRKRKENERMTYETMLFVDFVVWWFDRAAHFHFDDLRRLRQIGVIGKSEQVVFGENYEALFPLRQIPTPLLQIPLLDNVVLVN